MQGNIGWIWSWAADGIPPSQLLGTNHYGIPVRVILWFPIQGVPWDHARQPAVLHHSQRGGECGGATWGDGGGVKRGGDGGFWEIISDGLCALLRGKWTPCIPTTSLYLVVPGRPYGTL